MQEARKLMRLMMEEWSNIDPDLIMQYVLRLQPEGVSNLLSSIMVESETRQDALTKLSYEVVWINQFLCPALASVPAALLSISAIENVLTDPAPELGIYQGSMYLRDTNETGTFWASKRNTGHQIDLPYPIDGIYCGLVLYGQDLTLHTLHPFPPVSVQDTYFSVTNEMYRTVAFMKVGYYDPEGRSTTFDRATRVVGATAMTTASGNLREDFVLLRQSEKFVLLK